MGKQDYIPEQDSEFIVWLRGFAQYVQAHAAELDISPAKVAELTGKVAANEAAYEEHLRVHDLAKGAFEEKARLRKETEAMARSLAQVLQVRPETTDAQREGLGLRVPDRIRTTPSPERILLLEGPNILLDWSGRSQVAVHVGPSPGKEHENALPEGTKAAALYVRQGAGGEGPWTYVATITRSPFVYLEKSPVPVTLSFRACYLDSRMRPGPFGAPATCTVSV
jgi:hypothetical protein